MKAKTIVGPTMLLVLASGLISAVAQGTAFTYQGRLDVGGAAGTGLFDFRFALFDSPVGGSPVAGPVTNSAVEVTNGVFTTVLDLGAGVFTGEVRWLEIAVRTNGAGAFTLLSPRQFLTPTPHALYAASAGAAGAVPAGGIVGSLSLAQLPAAVLTNNATGVYLSGTFSGDGADLANVSLMQVNAHGAIEWETNINFQLVCSPTVAVPMSVTAADVNGDRKWDLISANGNRLAVLTNAGYGQFILACSPPAAYWVCSVVAVDVNGDNWVDLISAGSVQNMLSVLTNDGSGNFSPACSLTTGPGPKCVTTADINADGLTDLIAANSDTNTLSVFTNLGSGSFVLAELVDVPSAPICVKAVDVNIDGKPDLVVANYLNPNLTVLTNTGSGGFALASSPALGVSPMCLTAAEVNGDGKTDLICGGAEKLSILTNTGNGFELACSLAVAGMSRSIVSADVNADGRVDLISAQWNRDALAILTNNGMGSFSLACTLAAPREPWSVTAADLDADARPDLVSANYGSSTLSVYLNAPVYRAGFTGTGSGLASLNASELATGTVPEARLSTNVSLLGQSIESAEITDGTIVDGDISPAAAIADTKLATISTPGKVANSATTATCANTPNSIVARDASGNFAAGTITASGFSGNGAALTSLNASALTSGTVPADRIAENSITAVKLAGDAASLAKVSAGALNLSGGNLTATGTIASAQSSAMQISPLHARAVDAGLTITPVADHYGAVVVSAASAGTYRLMVPLDIPLKLYGRTPISWTVTTHYSHASTNNYITRTRVFCSHVAEIGLYQEDQTDRTSSTHSSFTVAGPNLFAEEWRGKAIEYQVTLSAGGSLRIGSIVLNYTY